MKQFESFQIDEQNECLWRGGKQIALPPRTFAVLRYLVGNPGRLISHDELLDKLWPDTFVQRQVLRTYMLELRKVLGDDARQPRFIRSQPKRGYVFVATVSESSGENPPAPGAANDNQADAREKELRIRSILQRIFLRRSVSSSRGNWRTRFLRSLRRSPQQRSASRIKPPSPRLEG